MGALIKIVLFSCCIASSICNPLSANVTGEFVECEIVPVEKSIDLLMKEVEKRSGRVVFGSLASTNQFPHLGYATLYKPNRSILCGGTLISPTWVVSAAHCLNEVYAGQFFFGSNDKQAMKVTQSINKYIMHPYYNQPTALANDIALVMLSAAVPLSSAVKAIKLPTRAEVGKSFTGLTMVASGFGVTVSGTLPRYLQYAYLTGLSSDDCKKAHWVFIEQMLCGKSATNIGSSVCGGDSGGPLIVEGATPTFIGVNSYVQTSSCVNDTQGFTRVDSYLDWISYNTGIYISY